MGSFRDLLELCGVWLSSATARVAACLTDTHAPLAVLTLTDAPLTVLALADECPGGSA